MKIYLRFQALLCSLFRAMQDHITNKIRRLRRFNVFFIGRCGTQASGTPPGASLYAKKYTTRYTPHCFMLVVVLSMCLCAQGQVRPRTAPAPVGNSAAIRPLSIGETLPEALWKQPLAVVNHPEGKGTITLNDYRGKLIILDFWASWCSNCLKAFPRIAEYNKQYKEHAVVLLVNSKISRDTIPARISDILTQRSDDKLFSIVNDELLKAHFPVHVLPYQIWIDDSGNIRAMTFSEYFNPANIEGAIERIDTLKARRQRWKR